ncbi:MAG: PDDEXK nuclease domain-containing protein [Clostridium sp.]|nr:PDDEXK nuclease domain-containing protein [Clostridium sp.]
MNKSDITSSLSHFEDSAFENLVDHIVSLVKNAKENIIRQIDDTLVTTNWHIGEYIIEFEQKGQTRATYGEGLMRKLSKRLTMMLGKGYSLSNLHNMRRLYLYYPKFQTVSGKLSWSHWCELLEIEDKLERQFYENECISQNWGVRTLRRQIDSGLFMRLAQSQDKKGVLELAEKGQLINCPQDAVKDTFVLEFLGIPEEKHYTESSLEKALIDNMQKFLLELGKGFAFIGEQYPIQIGNRHYHVDLVFYHAILKCYVLIDLKKSGVRHYDIGQMNMYLGYFANEVSQDDDNKPIGIVLCHSKNELVVEYATYGMDSNIFVSKYQLYLPNRDELRRMVQSIIEDN